LSNYRDAQGDGEDVVGDLKKISLPQALSNLMGLVNKVHQGKIGDGCRFPCRKTNCITPVWFAWTGSAKPASNQCWFKLQLNAQAKAAAVA
jgi:hypothetical protein